MARAGDSARPLIMIIAGVIIGIAGVIIGIVGVMIMVVAHNPEEGQSVDDPTPEMVGVSPDWWSESPILGYVGLGVVIFGVLLVLAGIAAMKGTDHDTKGSMHDREKAS
jgi:uncharacterized membrane protein